MASFLVGKEKVEDSSKYLVSRSSKQKVCEKCGEDLSEDSPFWKKLCGNCWKYVTFKKGQRITNIMDRLNESNIVHNGERKW